MKLIKPKQLLPLSLLIIPVKGKEMVINFNGLKTPWPIVLISFLIFIFSAITLKMEKYSLNWLTKFTFFLNVIRPTMALGGSINSLIKHGIKGFEYSETASWSTIALPFFLETIKRGLDRLEWWNIMQEELPMQILEDETEEKKINEYKLLKKIWSLRYFCWSMTLISCLWQFFAFFIYLNTSNFLKNTEFIAECTKKPSVNGFPVNCEGNTCYFAGSGLAFADAFNRFGGLLATWASLFVNIIANFDKRLRDRKEDKGFKWFMAVLSGFFLLGLISSILGQKNGLVFNRSGAGISGLEFCNLNFSYTTSSLNSKSGYIWEWFNQEWTSLKQITLV